MRKAAAFVIAIVACLAALFPARFTLENGIRSGYGEAATLDLTDNKFKSVVLQHVAAGRGEVMLYGSSEFLASIGYSTHPYVFFGRTGLQVNLVGRAGFHSLVHAADLGSLGDSLEGKKVVFFLSPQWFNQDGIDSATFDASSSVVQIFGLLFNPRLSEQTKQAFAARYTAISSKVSQAPFVAAEDFCRLYAKTDPASRAKRIAVTPYYWTQYQLLLLKDDLKAVRFMRNGYRDSQPAAAAAYKEIDWQAVLQKTKAEAAALSNNNPFGMENDAYLGARGAAMQKGYADTLRLSTESPEYTDFQILLDVCREEGIKPLIISVPVNGKWYDYEGMDPQERQEYYAKVRDMVHKSGFELADFSGYEDEEYFMNDPYHLGWIGWAYVDQAVYNYCSEDQK